MHFLKSNQVTSITHAITVWHRIQSKQQSSLEAHHLDTHGALTGPIQLHHHDGLPPACVWSSRACAYDGQRVGRASQALFILVQYDSAYIHAFIHSFMYSSHGHDYKK